VNLNYLQMNKDEILKLLLNGSISLEIKMKLLNLLVDTHQDLIQHLYQQSNLDFDKKMDEFYTKRFNGLSDDDKNNIKNYLS
jgi:hypothetical protein